MGYIEELEKRLLYSADLPGADIALAAHEPTAATHAELDQGADAGVAAEVHRRELVVVDARTPDYEQLIDGLQSEDGRRFEVVVLDAERSGIEQISEALAERDGLAGIHLISHGDAGELTLGSDTLDHGGLLRHAQTIAGWGDSLTADGDLLIYGCDLASTEEGQGFVQTLAQLTGADVAASDDMTGHASKSADWELEFRTGELETAVVAGDIVRQDWTGTLDADAVQTSYSALPLGFEENDGQTDDAVDFYARGGGYSVFLTGGDAVLEVDGGDGRHVVRLDLEGANDEPTAAGHDELASRSNYLIGNDPDEWRTGVGHYASVYYTGVYDGIDLRYYGNQRQLEYDFIVDPGADSGQIRLNFSGIASAEIADNGDLVLALNEGGDQIRFNAPVSYQLDAAGNRESVASEYRVHEDGTIGFIVGDYDATRELVIDPVLDYTTFLGGTGYDTVEGIAADSAGNVYITGYAGSADFPTTTGALDETYGGGSYDIYVAKLSADGSSLLYSTFIGGAGSDMGHAIAVDAGGNAYVIGQTSSSDFATVNAYQNTLGGSGDAVILKLNGAGDSLLYSSYFGGTSGAGSDVGYDLALDGSDGVFVTGQAYSADMPLKNAYDSTLGGATDAFVARFDLSQSGDASLLYSSLFGGSGSDHANTIAVDSTGAFTIAGTTSSADLATLNGYQAGLGGGSDAFITRFTSTGAALTYSTYLGGGGTDYVLGAAVDGSGNVYVGGRTNDVFPTTAGAYDTTASLTNDGFVSKIDPTLTGAASLIYSTYLGSTGFDFVYGVDVDSNGVAYVAGFTSSASFPTTIDGNDRTRDNTGAEGKNDGFFATLSADGGTLEYSTFIGGSGQDRAKDVVWNAATGAAYVGGQVEFQDDVNAAGPTSFGPGGGGDDAFVTKFTFNQAPTATSNSYTVAEGGTLVGNVISDDTGAGVDSDPDTDPLTASLVDGPLHGSLALNPDGSFTYTPYDAPGDNFADSDSFTYQISDAKGGTDTATVGITVTPDATNEAPVHSVTGAQTTGQDIALVLSDANGNRILVRDDAGGNAVEVTLTATNGTVTLSGTTGLTITGGADGSAGVTVQGTLGDINAALDGLTFTPTASYLGSASVQIDTDDLGNSGAGGVQTDSDLISIDVVAVNDPPVNTVPAAQAIDQNGMLLFASTTGTAISISDPDAGANPVEVTLTATNGTLNLAGTEGLTLSTGDGTGDATMNFTGTIADVNAALEGMTFVATPGFTGAAGVQITTDDLGNTGDGGAQSDTDNVAITVAANASGLWMSTEKNVASPSGATGLDSWSDDTVIEFGGAGLALENPPETTTTSGSFSGIITQLDAFAGGDANVTALHYVSRTLDVGGPAYGGTAPAFTVQPGDVLLSTKAGQTFTSSNSLSVNKEDVFVFRPDAPGDYSSGSFYMLLDNPAGAEIRGITLIEQDVTVGDAALSAGDFLFTRSGGSEDQDIWLFQTTDVGAGTTSGTASILLQGEDAGVGLGSQIWGVDLVEAETTIGGRTLAAGTLLLSKDSADTVGGNALAVQANDVFALSVTNTTLVAGSGNGAATATLLFDGGDAGLDSSDEDLDAFTLMVPNQPPVADTASLSVDENSAEGTVVGSATATDPNPDDTLNYAITAGNVDGAFAIDAATGQITVANSAALDYETTRSFDLTVAAIDSQGAYGTATVSVSLNNLEEAGVNDAPGVSVPGDQSVDRDGMLVFAAETGTAISVSDFDAGSGEVEVTLSATNGTLNLSGKGGLSFSVGDGTGDAAMTFTGTIADVNAALQGMTFVASAGFTGTADVQLTIDDQGNTGTGPAQSATGSVAVTVQAPEQSLWLTFENDEGGTGNADIPSVTGGDVVTFGDVTQLETSDSDPLASTTGGTFAYGFNLDTVLLSDGVTPASGGNTRVDAVHYVTRDIQVGTNDLQLLAGDLLLSLDADETLDGVSYKKEDVLVFRPDTTGDYSQGSFFRLIDGKNDIGWGKVTAITLVERTTVVGDVTLNAGELLLANDGDGKNILRFIPGTLGETSTGTTTLLVKGVDVDIDASIGGLHLVQGSSAMGGRSLDAGQLLVSLKGDDSTVGDASTIDVKRQDVFVLDVTATGDGTSAATASRFFEGLDEGLDSNNESVWGITFQGNAEPEVDDAVFTVDENTAEATVIGSVNAADPEGGPLQYAIIGGNSGGGFAIDAATGQISVADSAALDYEGTPSFNLTVAAIDADGAYGTGTVTIDLNDIDEFDVTDPSDGDATADAVDENAADGTAVGITATAVDADGTTNTVTYSLADDAGGRFSIDANTGVVTVADGSLLDRESAASHDITVRATSADGSTADTNFTIALNDLDEFDVTAPGDADGTADAVDENAADGTAVGITASASDADATTNAVTYSLADDAGGRFAIDANTGVVTVADGSLLDREAAASHDITVRATSADGSTADTVFTIALNDLDEFDVTAPGDADATADAVDENAADGTAVGITASASDADATTNAVTYSLVDDAGGRFSIDTNSGVVTVADGTLLDREAAASHDITVRASSADGSTADTVFTIALNDLDEFDVGAPGDSDGTANAVDENAADGAAVGITASASDADATNNAVTYSLVDDAGGRFSIDTNTGVVAVADGTLLDREASASHDITVRASSADGSTADTNFTIALNDLDEFDVTVPSDGDATANTVDENATTGTTVGVTASASDADATEDVNYSLADDAGGRFSIDASTGVVTVADGTLLDREAAASHDITVRATSADGSSADTVFTIAINDVDEFDTTAPSDANATGNAVDENAADGTAVGITASASDADATTNAVTYSLVDDAGGRFSIDANTGVVTVADGSLLDREASASHDITVRATSADGSTADTNFTIALNDLDEFDVGAVTDSDGSADEVWEYATVGTAVGITAAASDDDATTASINYALDDDAGGLFAIDASTGEITVNGALDYETATSHDVTVRATSADGSFSTQAFSINVIDFNENGASLISDSDGGADTVLENSAGGTSVGITAHATDPDGGDTISYSLDDDASGRFTIDSNTGVITVNGALDREAAGSYDVTVRATSSDTSFTTRTFTIGIGDVDEFDVGAPSDGDATADAVDENAADGTAVGITASASDADATTNAVTYSLVDDAGGRFAVDASTGVVTVADGSLLDREVAVSHDVTVRATSTDGSTADTNFTIALNDLDEFDVTAPGDADGTADAVDENAADGTAVGITASASDADATTNAVTYSLVDDAGGRFSIDTNTGVVTVADGSLLDREAAASHDITVRATSADGSSADTDFTIAINDVDEFDVTAPGDADGTADAVDENAANGTAVGITATAVDADATTNAVTYSLVDDAGGRFAVDANTGVVTVADGSLLDRESAASHDITVRATSADGSTADTNFTIALNDLDEFDVTDPSDADGTADAVDENAADGAAVGITASASDADATNNAVTYSLVDDAGGRFAVDANTGVVTVADGSLLDRESAASHDITVRATSADGSTADTNFTIALNDLDEFDVTVPGDSDDTANAVDENAANGTAVGITASASDADATTNAVTYSLVDDAGGRFSIDTNTGVVAVADGTLLDREAAASHDVTVRATSADGSTADTVFTIALNDLDEFDTTAPSDANATGNAVDENAADGAAVGITASASDADATTNAVTYSLADDAGGRFAVDANTGVVTVADGSLLDREAAASHDITVRATSADGSTADTVFTIALNDLDEFDVTVPSDGDATANTVDENATTGTTVGVTASASDADATEDVNYSLADDAGGRFSIDASTGVVTVADGSLLDREASASHDITVRATSADGSSADTVFTIALNDLDEFDVTVPSDGDATANTVDENATTGTTVGVTASASDADATEDVNYSLADDAGGRFSIDASTGVVTVADGSLLDREASASHDITVRATSADGSSADTVFTIAINDVDEFDVTVPGDADGTADAVDENAADGTAVGITASASDADATTNAVTYSLVDDAGGRFSIDTNTGVVAVADGTLLDREAAASHDVTVRATSADGSTADTNFTIALNDLDEFDVTVPGDSDDTANAVDENAANGTAVGITASASDADATTNAVTYSLVDDAGGRFSIDASTGVVTVANGSLLDREVAASHDITVRATSADGSSADTVFTIAINDVDEFDTTAPSDANATGNAVDENAADGTAVGITASASDADATTNAVTYSLVDDAGGRFSIDANTGVVTVADGSLLDREVAVSHDVTVRATSTDGSTADTNFTIALNDLDEFDVGAPGDSDGTANAVDENAADGTAVGITASASDADATTNAVTYSLVDDAGGRFAVDANTGVVTVADGSLLDREAAASHDITVRASSADGSTADTILTIVVNDVNEQPTAIELSNTNLDENIDSSGGHAVGSLSTSDIDVGDTAAYSIVGGADAGLFSIGGTGSDELVLSDGVLDFEAKSSYEVAVRTTDSGGLTHDRTFTISVNDLNEAPSFASAAATSATEDAAYSYSVSANDPDAGSTLAISAPTLPAWLTLVDHGDGTATLMGTPGNADVGDHSVVLQVSDGGLHATQGFTLTVVNVNDAPVITSAGGGDTAGIGHIENDASVATVTASDIDAGDTLSYSLAGGADKGLFSIDAASGVLRFDSAPDYENPLDADGDGVYEVVVRAADGAGASDTQTLQITVQDQAVWLAADQAFSESAGAGDSTLVGALQTSGDRPTSFTITGGNASGAFAVDASGRLRIADATALGGGESSHQLQIEVSDGTTTTTQTVTVQVHGGAAPEPAPVEPPPAAEPPLDLAEPLAEMPDSEETEAEEAREDAPPLSTATDPSEEAVARTEFLEERIEFDHMEIASAEEPADDVAEGQMTENRLVEPVPLFARVVAANLLTKAGLLDLGAGAAPVAPFDPSGGDAALWVSLDAALADLDSTSSGEDGETELVVEAAGAAALSLTVGFVIWVLRTGALAASLLSITPLWSHIDPLPVLPGDDGEAGEEWGFGLEGDPGDDLARPDEVPEPRSTHGLGD